MLILASGGGCRKSASAPAPASSSETVARLHWLGIKGLGRETNAAYFMSVWNLPESKQLVAQTLDKLALALGGGSQVTNDGVQPAATNPQSLVTNYQSLVTSHPVAAGLRPLLEDLVQAECYVELHQATNQPGELALAIRLDGQRAELWTSNLTAVLGSMTNVQSLSASANCCAWRLPIALPASRLDLARVGEWTLLGMAPETNRLLAELSQRIRAEHTPVSGTGSRAATNATNYWLSVEVDLGRLAGALKGGQAGTSALLSWPAGLPKLSVTMTGAGGEVRTTGELKFAQPLPFEEAAWNIPTNLIYENLISFTAIRGFQPWLSSLKAWKDLELGATPNQVFFWAREGIPFLSYCAVPLPDASNCVARLTERLLNEGNAWMTTNAMCRFLPWEKSNGVIVSVPFMQPYLESVNVGGSDYVVGGLVHQGPGTNSLAPPALFSELTRRTNLVCYDWELTGPRIDAWLFTGQALRLICLRGRLPPECASLNWFKAAVPRLGNCATAVTRTAPDELSFVRRSAIGLTSVELHLLADWLESPQFPRRLSSQAAPHLVPPTKIRPGTNSVPAPRRP